MKPFYFLLFTLALLFKGHSQISTFEMTIKESGKSLITDTLRFEVQTTTDIKLATISDSIYKEYLEQGYFASSRSLINKINDSTFGQQLFTGSRYSTIYIKDSIYDASRLSGIPLSRKRNYYQSLSQLKTSIENQQLLLQEQGYPFAEVRIDRLELEIKQDTAIATIVVERNKPRSIDRIVVKGYPRYPKGLTTRLLQKSKRYTPKSIDRILRIIESTPYIKSVRAPEALFKKDSTLLYLYIDRVKSNQADGLIAFNNNDEDDLEITGYLQAKLLNNFNLGESIDFEYRNADGDQSTLDLAVSVPSVLFSRIGIDGHLNITRRDSTYQNSLVSLGASYPIATNLNTGINYLNKTSNATSDIGVQNRNADYDVNGLNLSINYFEATNDPLQPLAFKASLNSTIQRRDGTLSQDNQLILQSEVSSLFKLSDRLYTAPAINGYYIQTDNLQFNELVQIGGPQTIRGFAANSIDTSRYLTIKNELRYLINDQIYIHSITDAGVFQAFTTRNSQFLYSFGAGLAILTRAGILRLSAANGRFKGSNNGVSSTIAHLNLLVKF